MNTCSRAAHFLDEYATMIENCYPDNVEALQQAEEMRSLSEYLNALNNVVRECADLKTKLAIAEKERDDAVKWMRVVMEEFVLAGFPGGDSTVQLSNIRAVLKQLRER